MRSILAIGVLMCGLLVTNAEVHAWAGGGGHGHPDGGAGGGPYTWTNKTSVPEPSSLYALGSGLALVAGASWYLRRRK
jgi:hypothetical protein